MNIGKTIRGYLYIEWWPARVIDKYFCFLGTRQQGRSTSAISQLEGRSEAHRDGKNLEGIPVLALCRIDEGYAGTPLAQYF